MTMDPNYSPAPQGNDPFSFIMNHGAGQKAPRMPGGGGMKQRIIVVGAGATVLIIVIAIVMSILSSSGKGATTDITAAVKQQALLIYIADAGVQRAKTNEARNFSITTKLSLSSGQGDLSGIAKGLGVKLAPTDLKIVKSTTTDQLLTSAEQSNQFDATITQLLTQGLQSLQTDLRKAYQEATTAKTKQILTQQFNSTAILLGNDKSSSVES